MKSQWIVTLAFNLTITGALMISGNSQAAVDTTKEWIPVHLHGAMASPAPDVVVEFAKKYGGQNVLFIDDKVKCDRSIRLDTNIFVNTRTTYWDAMIQPPWQCKSPVEAILQRFLHEVGHIVDRSPGDPSLVSTQNGLVIGKRNGIWGALTEPREKVAWDFAFSVRDKAPAVYRQLLESVEKWYRSHEYQGKDWDELPEIQWRRVTGQQLPQDPWQLVPEAIRSHYQLR